MTWAKSSQKLVDFHSELAQKYECQRKQMFGFQVFFVNNNMFSGIYEEGITLRLSPEDRVAIVEQSPAVEPFKPLGRAMKEYVLVNEPAVYDKPFMNHWADRSYKFASNLPPKPTKTPKK